MTGKRRLSVIEAKEIKGSLESKKLSQIIFDTQKKILSQICVFAEKTKERFVAEAFDKMITQKIVREFDVTYSSLESINRVFDELKTDFAKECEAQGIALSHEPYCKGLQQILKWYQLLFIESFLHVPLGPELSNVSQGVDKQLDLARKKELLYKKILYFNNKLSEAELAFSKFTFPAPDYKKTDLLSVFYPLIKEEKNTVTMTGQSSIIQILKQEREELEFNLMNLNQETQEMIEKYKALSVAERKARCDLYESKLEIDVYYVKEFQETYKTEAAHYNKVFDKQKKSQVEKITFIENTISALTLPAIEFDKNLADYYQSTYWISKTAYQSAINGIYNLLKSSFTLLKENSEVFVLEREYADEYNYIKNSLPAVKKEVEKAFIQRAKEFLRDISGRNWRQIAAMRDEADNNFENELKNYIRSVKLSSEMTEIRQIQLLELRKEQLDKVWRDIFCQLFVNELESIKSEFNQVKLDRSDASLLQLTQLKEKLYLKKEQILRNVVADEGLKNRSGSISSILIEVYNKALKDPVMLAVENLIYRREQENKKSSIEIRNEVKEDRVEEKPVSLQQLLSRNLSSSSDEKAKTSPLSRSVESLRLSPVASPDASYLVVPRNQRPIKINSSKIGYSVLTNQPWKKALLCGLAVVAMVCVALTGWGLIAQLSAVAVIAALGGGGGAAGIGLGCFITGSGAYCSAKFRCHLGGSSPDPDDPDSALSGPAVVSSKAEYSTVMSTPIRSESGSYREILASPLGATRAQSSSNQAPREEKIQPAQIPQPVQIGWLSSIYGLFNQYLGGRPSQPEQPAPLPPPLSPGAKQQFQRWEEQISEIENRRHIVG